MKKAQKALLTISPEERRAAFVATDAWRLRLVMHPDLKLTLTDARQLSIRELVMFHAALDLVDAKKQQAHEEMERKTNSIRKR